MRPLAAASFMGEIPHGRGVDWRFACSLGSALCLGGSVSAPVELTRCKLGFDDGARGRYRRCSCPRRRALSRALHGRSPGRCDTPGRGGRYDA